MAMDKHELVRIFNETGLLLELKGENPFKARAYYHAARTIENLSEDLAGLAERGELAKIAGFGATIVEKIEEWLDIGTVSYYEDLRSSTPAGLFEMLRLPGLGPKKIQMIHQQLGISGLEELERACHENRLAALPGFGAKTQEKICAGIEFIKQNRGFFLWAEGYGAAVQLLAQLRGCPSLMQAEIAGSLRRFKEIVHDIDLLAATDDPQAVGSFFQSLPDVKEVTARGDTKISVLLRSGIAVDLRIVKPAEFPHAWQHFTGSKEHNTALRHLAKGLGSKVNEYGITRAEEVVHCPDETAIYQMLGLQWIPPELREDLGELEAAGRNLLPDLVQSRDLKGLFHIHTSYSDGVHSLEELVLAAIERGYQYLGISDHSQIAVYAHGLPVDRLERQWAEIAELRCKYPGFRIFQGIEADILPSGQLDYGPEVLSKFDFVIGSVHSQFKMSREAMTARILRAMEDPYLTMLGHPTGRILLERSGYEVDLEALLQKAAATGVVMEFNASPYRLDLDWRWLRRAKELRVPIAINPDAHGIPELDLARGSLMFARKGWLEAKDVLNTRSGAVIAEFLQQRRTAR